MSSWLLDHALGVAVLLLLLGLLDFFGARHTRSRWMTIHAVANAVVSALAAPDVLRALDLPMQVCVGRQSSDVPCRTIVALHMYHLLFFKCSVDDWIHHLVFVSAIGGVGLYFDGGALLNFIAFFMCGLPGGLDYAMLVLVKHEWASPEWEKTWNARINVWLRSPGLLLGAWIGIEATRHGPPQSECAKHPVLSALVASLIVLNSQYYMQRVTGNTYRKVQQFSS